MTTAIFFDLDGTLWDALDELTQSWNEAMIKNNYPYRFTKELMQSFMGLTPLETIPKAFPNTTVEEGLKLFKIVLDAEIKYLKNHPGTLYPNEIQVLDTLSKKYPLYVVSNSDKGYVENYLSACKTEKYFKGHICAGDTGLAKWENILYLQKLNNIDDVIYIGDTLKDYIETTKAHATFIHAAYGFGKIEDNIYKINSLDELDKTIDQIINREN
jgi:phosphoglycolate phosphatase